VREQLNERSIRAERHAQLRQSLRQWPPQRVEHVPLVGTGVFPSAIADSYIGAEDTEPPYVHLDHDHELLDAVRSAAFIIVIGEPKTGKSRVAWEAARTACGKWWMLAPVEGANLRALFALDPFQELPSREPVLIWLDDLDSYLGVGGLDEALLHELVTSTRRVVLLCTIRSTAHEDKSLGGTAERVLVRARRAGGTEFHLHQENSRAELLRARRAYPGLAFRASIGYELVASDELVSKFRAGESSPGGALVRAAADWRRLGLTGPIQAKALRALASGYVGGAVLNDATAYEQAVLWATAPVSSSAALIRSVGQGADYRVDDLIVAALDGRIRSQFDLATPIADHAWLIAKDHISREEQVELGRTARRRRLLPIAELILVQAAANPGDRGTPPPARHRFQFRPTQVREDAHLSAIATLELSIVKSSLGDIGGARAAVRRALRVGIPNLSRSRLAEMLGTYDYAIRSRDKRALAAIHGELIDVLETRGYETFTLSEIHDQVDAVRETVIRNIAADGTIDLGEGEHLEVQLLAATQRICVVGCGSSYHAGLIGSYAMEEWARIPVDVDIASEYRYRNPVVGAADLVIGITQSGETADTLAAMRVARERGARVLALTNVLGSQATRDADGVLFTHAGIEIAVAATKTFVTQLAMMYLLALRFAEMRGTLEPQRIAQLVKELKRLPHYITEILDQEKGVINQVAEVAQAHRDADFILYLGRHAGLGVALEGALKLKEFAYIAADAYAAGEMKHGPIALLDESTPVVCVTNDSPVVEKMVSNMQEARARGAHVIAIASEGKVPIGEYAEQVIRIPRTDWMLQPLLAVIPLQLLAYEIARLRGLNVDQPRNLAKTVTVE
jgi:fructoselysine-6-P-deglycase FrlB-like protein